MKYALSEIYIAYLCVHCNQCARVNYIVQRAQMLAEAAEHHDNYTLGSSVLGDKTLL